MHSVIESFTADLGDKCPFVVWFDLVFDLAVLSV